VSDSADAKDQPDRHNVGTTAPNVPFLTRRQSVDLGPAGSLIQARDRERVARISRQPAVARDWRIWLGGGLTAVALALVVVCVRQWPATASSVPDLMVLMSLTALAAVCAIGSVSARFWLGQVEGDLARQITRERNAARELDLLRSLGWTVLHDRLVPGTEHRVAHVLAGPAGLMVATVLPVAGPIQHRGSALMTGDVPLGEWFAARWWEAEHINDAMAVRLGDWPWTGPIYPVALLPDDRSLRPRLSRQDVPTPGMNGVPPAYSGVAIRATGRVRQWATAMPAPLGRLASAQLAAALEAACLPAGTRD
jgi:hypothetical protein